MAKFEEFHKALQECSVRIRNEDDSTEKEREIVMSKRMIGRIGLLKEK